MNNRGLLILIAIFLALVAAVFLQNRETEQDNLASPTGIFSRVFPELAVLDIQAIQVLDLRTEESFTMSRDQSGVWTAPYVEGELIQGSGTGIAQTVVFLPINRTIEITDETDLSEFGFDPYGYIFIQVLLLTGEQHVVAIGNSLQDGTEFYILVDQQPFLYTAPRGLYVDLISLLNNPPIVNQ